MGSFPAEMVVCPLSSDRKTRFSALPKPMSSWQSSATLVSETGATPDRYSPWLIEQGSGRELHVWPSTVTSSVEPGTKPAGAIRAAGTATYATCPCRASTARFVTGRAIDACVHVPWSGAVRHRVVGCWQLPIGMPNAHADTTA